MEEQWLAEQERWWAYEELRRRKEERRLTESRRIRELEYDTERQRVEARLEEEEEWKDPESLVNRLRDFEDVERGDRRLQNAKTPSRRLTIKIIPRSCVMYPNVWKWKEGAERTIECLLRSKTLSQWN